MNGVFVLLGQYFTVRVVLMFTPSHSLLVLRSGCRYDVEGMFFCLMSESEVIKKIAKVVYNDRRVQKILDGFVLEICSKSFKDCVSIITTVYLSNLISSPIMCYV